MLGLWATRRPGSGARPYRTEQVSSQFEELMLKGISVPTYQVSAMTMRNPFSRWL